MPTVISLVSEELEKHIEVYQWKKVVVELGVVWNKVSSFANRSDLGHHGPERLISKTLEIWYCRKASEATMEKLVAALNKAGLGSAAKSLQNWPPNTVVSTDYAEEPLPPSKDEILSLPTMPPLQRGHPPPAGNDIYKCPDNHPRGFVLIINVMTFEANRFETRDGSTHDIFHFSELFAKLSHPVKIEQDTIRTPNDLSKALDNFYQFMLEQKEVGSVIIIIGTHGYAGNLFTKNADGCLSVEEVVNKFQTDKLKGIPKIFIFQACRGNRDMELPKLMTDGPSEWKDTILCYPSLKDFKAYRDEEVGSWYLYCLVKMINEHAHKMSFKEILNNVGGELVKFAKEQAIAKNRNGRNLPLQLCEFEDYNFKTFWFNTSVPSF